MKKLMKRLTFVMLTGIALTFAGVLHAADESFTTSIQILTALSITEQSALLFPDTEASSSSQAVVVAPADSGAATFDIAGQGSEGITASIVENSVSMVNGSTTITVASFTFGGSLASSGTGTLSSGGSLNSCKVGATASIPANPGAGTYSGTLTFRVVYN